MSDGLKFAEILTLAENESGAFGLADEGLIARASGMVDWINQRGPYTTDQLWAMRVQVQRVLTTRLRLKLDRQLFPAITGEQIERPVFVIGFPRSGTTLMHSLLAEDPETQSLKSWHVYSPSPPPGAGPVVAEHIAYAQRRVEEWMDFCPGQKPMHPYIDKGAHQLIEDEESFTIDFQNAYVYHYFRVPTLEPMAVPDADPVGAFSFHRELLQHQQWNSGKTRWACKGPSHQNNLDSLFKVYPDALCVWNHRPVSEIFPSICSLSAQVFEAVQGKPGDRVGQARILAQILKQGFDRMLQNDMLDDPRILHLSFREVAKDPAAAVRTIYAKRGLDVSKAFDARMAAWLGDAENAVDRYGRYPYSYEAIGLAREEIEEMFADYSTRFGLD
jgi:Sulfotransferase family